MQISQEMLFGIGLFATVTVLAFALSGLVFRRDRVTSRLRRSLPQEGEVLEAEPMHPAARQSVPVMGRIGQAAARPFMPKSAARQSKLRRTLMNAGLYSPTAMEAIVGAQVMLLAAGLLVGYAVGGVIAGRFGYVVAYVLAVIGFFIPHLWLKARIKGRRKALDSALPDALDLMVVCVESGLTLDASLQRVGQEIALAHPDISREFGITHMETRVGISRIEALRNLGQRTGCASLQSLAAMLVQTERFGTSIAQALRVHAESLRVKRQHAAEEQAAKTSVKLAFPVVLFIFPCLLVVLGGPAIILFLKSPLFHRQ